MLILTHTEVTNTMSTVYTTLDYEYRHKNKGIGLVWCLESVGCTNETKMCTATLKMLFYIEQT